MRNSSAAVLSILCVGFGFLVGTIRSELNQPSVILPMQCSGEAQVSNLIQRLKPLVKGSYSYRGGVTVEFDATNNVTPHLEIDRSNKYSASAPSLSQAVERMTLPSAEIRKAVEGWK